MRRVAQWAGITALAAGQAFGQAPGQAESANVQNIPILIEGVPVETRHFVIRPSGNRLPQAGGFDDRDGCPQTRTYTNASFEGGTYTAQGGFAEGEIAAVSYTLPASLFPLKFISAECIFAQQNAVVTTTTQWSILIWEGTPTNGVLVATFSTSQDLLEPIVMGPGTRGVNILASIDPADPDQLFIFNPNNLPNQTFTVGFRIDQHNDQTANPCFTAPPANRNAFPVTDNTVIGCGSGYSALNNPSENWLFALNCGANGCPPNGGWTRFSGLQADQNFFGICLTGCRPRGDWVMRATFDPVNCPPPEGACCFGTFGCALLTQTACQGAGGSWRGGGTTCGSQVNGQWSGCIVAPNQPPVANAGSDITVTDVNNDGLETIVVDGNGSTDSDGFIANFRWNEGATILQDGPAFLSTNLPVGVHTLTLTVTDDDGATATDTMLVTINAGEPQCAWQGDGCFADFNNDGGIDGDDVIAFFAEWDNSAPCGDVDASSGVDGDDVIAFFGAWDAAGVGSPGC